MIKKYKFLASAQHWPTVERQTWPGNQGQGGIRFGGNKINLQTLTFIVKPIKSLNVLLVLILDILQMFLHQDRQA